MTAEAQRGILVGAVRRLVEEARTERALIPEGAPERQFYLGVEAAADGVLHPELEMTRTSRWVDQHPPAFREGFVRTTTLLATARAAAEAPLQLRLPDPSD